MKYTKGQKVINEKGHTLKCICADSDTAVFGRYFKKHARTSYRKLVAYSNFNNSTDSLQKLD